MEPTEPRPDVDIEEDIKQIIHSFSPLQASRAYFTVHSENGVVTLKGNVRNPQARRVMVDNIPRIEGVKAVISDAFFDDEMIRFKVGELLPPGVHASVMFGAVALTGRLPSGASADIIIKAIAEIPGVLRVGADFGTVREAPLKSDSQ
ncbi:MAG: BON domain-containing protein [Anaerolineae bacterium]|nr:BON domain-containing protein [Anaerolineae bacterium]